VAQFYVTVDEDVMREVFQEDGGLAKLVEAVLNQILQVQVTEHLQAAPYQRIDER
jgi:putative transposase